MTLTKAQMRYLQEIHNAGVKSYNGRAEKVLKALEDKGLVEWDLDIRLGVNGSSLHLTAWLTKAGEEMVA